MAWKATIPWFGAIATLTAGFVWARWGRSQRSRLPQQSQSASPASELDDLDDLEWIDFVPNERDFDGMARTDALRALEPSEDGRDLALDLEDLEDPQVDILEVDILEREPTADLVEHVPPGNEPYDAVDAEDMGAAWLRRATQSSEPTEEPDPSEAWGRHVIEAAELDGAREASTDEEMAGRAAAEAGGLRARR